MAPQADMNDSASLLSYADWARRNGYDDEARQYLALGYRQKQAQEQKSYKTFVNSNTEKLRGFNTSIANLQAAIEAGDPNAQAALDKVLGARTLLIKDMNQYGSDSNYGSGNEGSAALRTLQAEELALADAAMQRKATEVALQNDLAALQDTLSESEPIPLSFIPPHMQDRYRQGILNAKENPQGEKAGIRDLNKEWGKISSDYLASLVEGDKTTTQLIWKSVSDIRNSDAYDDDTKEYISENPQIVSSAVEQAERSLSGNSEFRTAGPEKKQQMAEQALVEILRGQNEKLDEEMAERRQELAEDSRNDTNRSRYAERDRVRQYKPGYEQGGPRYKEYLKRAQEQLGEEFDLDEFDREWDKQFFSPGGAISPTSATGMVLRKGPL
jgi:hypothetical protein